MIRDLTGERFGRLLVLERLEDERASNGFVRHYWLCQCDCGMLKKVMHYNLTNGSAKSCGCLSKDRHSKQNGLCKEPLYGVWTNIKKRCYSKTSQAYHNYGGRGIGMCDEWRQSFLNFYEWANSNGYKRGLSIDRINNDGDYEPSNCRWVDVKTQSNNRRQNHFIEFDGKKLSLAGWESVAGIRQETIRKRLKKGWSVEKALTTQVSGQKGKGLA